MMDIIFECPNCRRQVTGIFPTFIGSTQDGMRYDVTCELCLHQSTVLLEPKEFVLSKPIHDVGLDEIFLN